MLMPCMKTECYSLWYLGIWVRMKGATIIFPESSGKMFYALYWLVIYVPVGSQVHDLPNMFEQL